MKASLLLVSLLISASAFAGPSISGGIPPAPGMWTKMIFNEALEKMRPLFYDITAITLKKPKALTDLEQIVISIKCDSGNKGQVVYDVKRECSQSPDAPLCLPSVELTLKEELSHSCQ